MTPITPDIEPLSIKHRRRIFIMSILTFVMVVPALVFYAIGYRIEWGEEARNIRTVGGMYVSADYRDVSIYIDNEPVEDMRIFQSAAYVQNLDAGLHQIHVQGEEIQTWVKVLPVQAHFVTEVSSFNLPTTTQFRLVTEFVTDAGEAVIADSASTTFALASTTNQLYATSSNATTTYSINPEFTYLSTLLASSSEEKRLRVEQEAFVAERFTFSTATTASSSIELATTTKEKNDVELREVGGEVQAFWIGNQERAPHYFCVDYRGPGATKVAYGSHVYDDLVEEYASTTGVLNKDFVGQRLCRESVRIDRKWQSVQYFDFVPGRDDLVLMQLQDGVYVVEIDDRAWQNMQLLYAGDYLEVVVDSNSIFIKDGEYIMEVFTRLQN